MAVDIPIIDFRIPFPPSVNGLYNGGHKTRKRFKSAGYKKWISSAQPFIDAYLADNPKFVTIRSEIAIWYRHGLPDKRIRDVENYCKATSDLLVDMKIIEDDSLIKRSISDWSDDIEPGITEVVIAPLIRMAVSII